MTHWTEKLFEEQADRFAQFFEGRFDAADEQVEELLDLVADEYGVEPERTLDVACGVGRHVVAFAERGCVAEGLDFSAPFVERARERATEHGIDDRATVRQHDMRDLGEWSGGPYDLVTSFWNSLGYYGRETDEQVLREARRLLDGGSGGRDGDGADGAGGNGVLAVELGNKDHYLANFREAGVDEDGDQLRVERREYDVATGRFHTRLDLFDAEDYEHVDRLEWDNRVYAPAVLRELCLDAGFDDVSLFGGFGGDDLTMESDTVVALAR